MRYHWELDSGHRISIDNQGEQTFVTVSQTNSGQQQQASSSFTTGSWISPPEMTLTPTGGSVKIITASGESIVRINGTSIQLHSSQNLDREASALPNRRSTSSSSSSSTFSSNFQPMPPMQMGNMQMNMQPMTMRMGDMELNTNASSSSSKKFCTQCGNSIKSSDKFCANCGHKLDGV